MVSKTLTYDGRCPFCAKRVIAHCNANKKCTWLRCTDRACNAFGPATGMVRL